MICWSIPFLSSVGVCRLATNDAPQERMLRPAVALDNTSFTDKSKGRAMSFKHRKFIDKTSLNLCTISTNPFVD